MLWYLKTCINWCALECHHENSDNPLQVLLSRLKSHDNYEFVIFPANYASNIHILQVAYCYFNYSNSNAVLIPYNIIVLCNSIPIVFLVDYIMIIYLSFFTWPRNLIHISYATDKYNSKQLFYWEHVNTFNSVQWRTTKLELDIKLGLLLLPGIMYYPRTLLFVK